MNALLISLLLGLSLAQPPPRECVYSSGRYELNLTRESTWTLEKETPEFFFYYTPCRNGLQCRQGNADYYGNVAQFKQGANQCIHYLSVDHHDEPEYSFYGAAWVFRYRDGETCDTTQSPREVNIYMHCNEELNSPLVLYDINEPRPCEYVLDIRGNAACVPESSHNAECQWRVSNGTGGYYYLDLSPLKNTTIYSRLPNGYYHTITPCRNGVYCYQEYGTHKVMGVIDNHQTGTCEHYGAIWEDGRVQPILHNVGTTSEHWSFHYFNGQSCSNGEIGEEEFRFFCDPTADEPKVMNTTQSNCRFDINIATKYACTSMAEKKLPKYYNRPNINDPITQIKKKLKKKFNNVEEKFLKYFGNNN